MFGMVQTILASEEKGLNMLRVIWLGVLTLLLLTACAQEAPSGAKPAVPAAQDSLVVTVYKSPT